MSHPKVLATLIGHYASWYVIDSHVRNSRGMVDENGSSEVLKFSNFHAFLFYLRSFVETTTSERDLDVNDLTFETLIRIYY